MKLSRVLAIARKQFLTLRHDPRSIGLILLAPIIAMLVFGFAFGTEIGDVPVAVVDLDGREGPSGESAAFLSFLDKDAVLIHDLSQVDEGRRRVMDAEFTALIIIPANFTEGLTSTPAAPPTTGPGGLPVGGAAGSPPRPPNGTMISLFIDSSNSQKVAVVQKALASAMKEYAESKGGKSPVALDVTSAYGADARFIDFFVPGIMAFAALLFTTLLTLLAFVGERANGTLDRLRATPASEAEIVAGYALAFGIIGAVQGIVLLAAAILLFDILIVGNLFLAALIIVLLAVDSQAIGILLSALAQREGQAVMMLPFIIFPTFLLSGIFVPTETLPGWLQPLAYLLPPTWAVDAMRGVFLRGWGLERVGVNILVLMGFAVVFIGAAVAGLRRSRA